METAAAGLLRGIPVLRNLFTPRAGSASCVAGTRENLSTLGEKEKAGGDKPVPPSLDAVITACAKSRMRANGVQTGSAKIVSDVYGTCASVSMSKDGLPAVWCTPPFLLCITSALC